MQTKDNNASPAPEHTRIAIADAEAKELKAFAEMMLGIEIAHGTNAAQMRVKIQKVAPDLKEIPVLTAPPAAAPAPIMVQTAADVPAMVRSITGETPETRPAAVSRPPSAELLHQSFDPKVELEVLKSSDKYRPRVATVQVNGIVTQIERGVKVEVPYRVYLALMDARENISVETDQINPATGDPVREWQEVLSYPFLVHSMPSKEEIAEWHRKVDDGFQGAQPLQQRAA
jgi:hypothetical protein